MLRPLLRRDPIGLRHGGGVKGVLIIANAPPAEPPSAPPCHSHFTSRGVEGVLIRFLHFTGPSVPITAMMHSTPKKRVLITFNAPPTEPPSAPPVHSHFTSRGVEGVLIMFNAPPTRPPSAPPFHSHFTSRGVEGVLTHPPRDPLQHPLSTCSHVHMFTHTPRGGWPSECAAR
eukprot:191720-Prorocentrum_minimum.AAC.1